MEKKNTKTQKKTKLKKNETQKDIQYKKYGKFSCKKSNLENAKNTKTQKTHTH